MKVHKKSSTENERGKNNTKASTALEGGNERRFVYSKSSPAKKEHNQGKELGKFNAGHEVR